MAIDQWMLNLKAAYDAGYYRTEAAEGQQEKFPWQNKTCADCPFYANAVCQVHAVFRPSTADTCAFFDQDNREIAADIIRERRNNNFLL